MNRSNDLFPRIRYKAFKSEWTLNRIDYFFDERTQRNSEGKLLSVTINDGIVDFESLKRKDNSSKDKSNYKVVCKNDIAYNSMRMWQGASGESSYDGIVSPAYTVITPLNNSNSRFFSYSFKRIEMLQKFQRSSQGLTSDTWNLKFNLLKQIRIAAPSKDEQKKIATVLDKISDLITVSERKIKQQRTLKSMLLQKVFSQTWRFKEFNDPWEQRKLGQLYKKSKCKNDLSYDSNQTISVATMSWSSSNVDSSDAYMKTYNIFKKGDIAFEGHKSNEYKFGRFVLNNLGDGIVSHIFDVFNPITPGDQNFWSYFIHNDQQMHQILAKSTTQATMMNSLVARDFMKQSINVPKYEEQAQIGGLLKSIDNLIVANEKKLDQLKQLKKYLMQNMFV
ncbi:restriction endonuclease subunit S [Levilactobacillus parabrevis]|uniref:restriction endonuclease subunit S n=1 Tax=Levilactobacillus parabrevis TaxID=357278 RepID=UPI0021A313B3|nr:restriction endonuclease subunit S [Levilactobacillus parabrevis]MCT4487883.1 restriction endonuclease subunit S [Levilactobacillus parabrevis]MCT4491487.1 restriction endonuclease subunit S [Levilactobacillus parabrevis]